MELAERMRFEPSCAVEVGRLLRVLAGQIRTGRIGEIGTGCGVGAAWIVGALAPAASFVTVEIDVARAAAVERHFRPYPNVRVLHGDWHDLLRYGPFAMLFADVAGAKEREAELLVEALQPGGIVVLDDLTPEGQEPPDQPDRPDPVRAFWLTDPRLHATELLVSPTMAVILATRVR